MRKYFIFVILMLPLALGAQTVTVDAGLSSPDNTSTFNSLQVAITSFQASGDATAGTDGGGIGKNHGNGSPDVINIITTTPIDEAIFVDAEATAASGLHVLDEAITIQGQSINAIVCLQQSNFGSIANDCGLFWRQDVNLTINNIIFLPSTTNTPADDALFFFSRINGVHTVITVDNVMLTANNGSNAPIISTGLEDGASVEALLDAPGTVGFGDDGIYLAARTEGGSITMNATNLIVSAFNKTFTMDPARTGEGSNDGFYVYMNGATQDLFDAFLNLNEGCVISQTPRFGIYNTYGGYVKINGSETKPVYLYNLHSDGIFNNSDATGVTQPSLCEVNNCIIVNCDNSGIKEQEINNRGFVKSVTNTIIANTKMPGIEFYADGTVPPEASSTVTIDNVTFHNCGYSPGTSADYDFRGACIGSPQYQTSNFSNRNIDITNTIISGAGVTGIYNAGSGTYNVGYSSLVTENMTGYEYALAAATAGSGTINLGVSVIYSNPRYITYVDTDLDSTDFMDVDNTAFGGKGTSASDLAGGADYVGGWSPPVITIVTHYWSLYE